MNLSNIGVHFSHIKKICAKLYEVFMNRIDYLRRLIGKLQFNCSNEKLYKHIVKELEYLYNGGNL